MGLQSTIGDEYQDEELIDFLSNNADSIKDDCVYLRRYSATELASVQENFLQNSIKIAELEQKKRDLVSGLNAEIKNLKANIQKNIQNIVAEGEEVTGRLFEFKFPEEKMVGLYDAQGNLVESRPFNQKERHQYYALGSHIRLSETGS